MISITNGHLYGFRFRAWSVVVAAPSADVARRGFQAWLLDTHGVPVYHSALPGPTHVRSLGERPLVIAYEAEPRPDEIRFERGRNA